MIRKTAEEGDLIFGFAANSLHRDNRLLYVARVTKKLADDEPSSGSDEGLGFNIIKSCAVN